MRFKTGFVVGCAAGLYLANKARMLQGPSGVYSGGDRSQRREGLRLLTEDSRADKMLALGDLARQRARDVLQGPVGKLAREKVIELFEEAVALQRRESARRA